VVCERAEIGGSREDGGPFCIRADVLWREMKERGDDLGQYKEGEFV